MAGKAKAKQTPPPADTGETTSKPDTSERARAFAMGAKKD